MLASYRSWAAAPCSSCLPCWPLRCRPPTPSPAARSYEPHASADPCRCSRSRRPTTPSAAVGGPRRRRPRGLQARHLARGAVLALGDERTRESLGPDGPAALAEGLRGALADGALDPGVAAWRAGCSTSSRCPRSSTRCSPLAALPHPRLLEDGATYAVVARLLVDAARRAACARRSRWPTYLAALAPGDDARPRRRRLAPRRLQASLAAALADGCSSRRSRSCWTRACARSTRCGSSTLLRDGADACQPLTWQKPSGPDAIAAQLALRTFVAAACELKTPAAPLASAISEDDPLAAVAKAAGVDRARAEQAIRNGLRPRPTGCRRTACCRRPAPTP